MNSIAESLTQHIADHDGEFTASEVQGFLVGLAAAQPTLTQADALARLNHWLDAPVGQPGGLISAIWDAIQTDLQDESFTLNLLIRDGEPFERLEDLSGWAQGFLLGFGLDDSTQQVSAETRQALDDMVAISQVSLEPSQDMDESDLESVVEYARMTAHLAFLENSLGVSPAPREIAH